jgi:hypothetical protein
MACGGADHRAAKERAAVAARAMVRAMVSSTGTE